ncbi:MAG: hypothetical protein NDI91_01280 [Sulfuritalea sp.]|nr:hypothetical protein [Sulfuritalea sp.]
MVKNLERRLPGAGTSSAKVRVTGHLDNGGLADGGFREPTSEAAHGHEPLLKNAPQRGRWRPVRMIDD